LLKQQIKKDKYKIYLLILFIIKKGLKGGKRMTEKLSAKRVSLSLAAVTGIISIVCGLLIAIAPQATVKLFGAIFHGLDVSQIERTVTFTGIVLGTLETIVLALIFGWLFAVIYNKIR